MHHTLEAKASEAQTTNPKVSCTSVSWSLPAQSPFLGALRSQTQRLQAPDFLVNF